MREEPSLLRRLQQRLEALYNADAHFFNLSFNNDYQ